MTKERGGGEGKEMEKRYSMMYDGGDEEELEVDLERKRKHQTQTKQNKQKNTTGF